MPASVPEGLVTVSGRVLSSELKDDGVDMNDIARLWRGISHIPHPLVALYSFPRFVLASLSSRW